MYDKITEVTKAVDVEKNIDEIEHVEKFNPFHDSRGRFSSARGMASYSANPKTKAGAMAIGRSASAGHTKVQNIHRESKGETIGQNDTWLKTGQKPTLAQTQRNQILQSRQKQWRQNQNQQAKQGTSVQQQVQNYKNKQNQQAQNQQAQNQQTQQAQQAASAANAKLAQNYTNVTVTPAQQKAIQPRNNYGHSTTKTKVADDKYTDHVKGTDISQTFDKNAIPGSKRAIDKVADAQGWTKDSATVTNDFDLFQKAAAKSGIMMFRSVKDTSDGKMTASEVCTEIMTNPKTSLGGNGLKAFGGGLYLVGSKHTDSAAHVNISQNHSFCYGPKQMMATVHPKAKIAGTRTANKLSKEFARLGISEQAKFDYDIGAYIASKGYDGAQWHNRTDPYITMYNKSAMIFYGQAYDR